MRIFLCTATAVWSAAIGLNGAVAYAADADVSAMNTGYATFDGPMNGSGTGGTTATTRGGHCIQVQSAATPGGAHDCDVLWSAGRSFCTAAPDTPVGSASYTDYRTGSSYSGITLFVAKGAGEGVLTGQYFDAGLGRLMQITINAYDACAAVGLAGDLGVRSAGLDAARAANRFTGRVNAVAAG